MLVRNCGCWLGEDLNDALDNLWFTFLFKRASVLTDSEARLENLFALFQARMQGKVPGPDEAQQLTALARRGRSGHPAEWLQTRLQSFLTAPVEQPGGLRWGWKEPNTHIMIERFLRFVPDLKYVHVVRDPFYMAASKNRNQLKNWGHFFLDRDLSGSAGDVIAYWVAVHKRLDALCEHYPGRIIFFSHDRFMADPEPEAERLLDFLQIGPPASPDQRFRDIVFQPTARQGNEDAALQADPDDLAFCAAFMARFA